MTRWLLVALLVSSASACSDFDSAADAFCASRPDVCGDGDGGGGGAGDTSDGGGSADAGGADAGSGDAGCAAACAGKLCGADDGCGRACLTDCVAPATSYRSLRVLAGSGEMQVPALDGGKVRVNVGDALDVTTSGTVSGTRIRQLSVH